MFIASSYLTKSAIILGFTFSTYCIHSLYIHLIFFCKVQINYLAFYLVNQFSWDSTELLPKCSSTVIYVHMHITSSIANRQVHLNVHYVFRMGRRKGQSMYFSARRIWQYISMENTKARIWREKMQWHNIWVHAELELI